MKPPQDNRAVRRWRLAVVAAAAGLVASAGWAQASTGVLVQLRAGHADIAGAEVLSGRHLIGKVGDVVVLQPGRHQLWVTGPRRYAQRSSVVVAQGTLTVEETSVQEPNCSDHFETTWLPPRLLPQKKAASAMAGQPARPLDLRIEAPSFGAKAPLSSCALPSMLACPERKALVTFSAEPPDAELWINNQQKKVPPGSTLSVPFCGDSSTAQVLWRAAGYANCSRQVELQPDAEVSVRCVMNGLSSKP